MTDLSWINSKRKVRDLIAWTENPRKLTEKQGADLRASLERFNLVEPPAVNLDGVIIGGHQRLKTLALLGRLDEEIDIRIPSRQLTQDEMIELNLRLNKNTAEWDPEKLFSLDMDKLLDVGFDKKQLDAMLPKKQHEFKAERNGADFDRPPEPIAKSGMIYTLGRHRLMCGDATNFEDARALLQGNMADMVFTDPPYGVNVTGSGGKALHGDMSFTIIPFAFDTIDAFLKPGSAVYVCGGGFNIQLYYRLFEKHWRQMPHPIIWVKENFILRHSHYHSQFEILFYGWKSGAPGNWWGDRKQTDVWHISREKNFEHPTIKPVELVAKALLNSSRPGDLVFDPFAGSGSTLIACEQTGRNCNTMEIDPGYCDVIIRRYCDLLGLKPSMIYETGQQFARSEKLMPLEDIGAQHSDGSLSESVAENATEGTETPQ